MYKYVLLAVANEQCSTQQTKELCFLATDRVSKVVLYRSCVFFVLRVAVHFIPYDSTIIHNDAWSLIKFNFKISKLENVNLTRSHKSDRRCRQRHTMAHFFIVAAVDDSINSDKSASQQ
jgi:hypothetical protein